MIAGLLEIITGSTFLTIFSLVTVYLVISYCYREYGPKDPSLPPVVPYYFPFIGSMITYGMNPIKFMEKYRTIYGDNFTMVMFGRKVTFCLGVDGNHTILNGKHTHFSAEEAYHSLTVPVFGKGVVYDVPNQVLMEQKKIGKNGMTTELLAIYVDLIKKETTEHLKQWGTKGSVGILHDMAKLIIKTASSCLLGHEIRAKLDDSVADIYHDLDGGFTPMQFMFEWLPLPSYYRRDAAHKKMSDLFYDIVQERRKSGKQNDDVVDALMHNSYKDGTMMTDRQIAHMMIALLMAGQHTSSTTSSWTLLLLAQNPEIQEELLKEQKEVFGEDFGDLTLEGLKKCTLLESCIKESLRLRPPIINIMRYVKQNCQIPNTSYVIPKGYYVMSAPIITQLDEKCFPSAKSFLPNRWLDPLVASGTNKTTKEDVFEDYGWATMNSSSARSSYLPFGAGRHRCIGEQFAYMQISTVVAIILRNYRIKLNEKDGFPNINFATLICSPLDPNLIEYEPRN